MKKKVNELTADWEKLRLVSIALLQDVPDQQAHTEQLTAELVDVLYILGVIENFDWMSWTEPPPQLDQIDEYDAKQASKHITRIIRSERFTWGELDANIKNDVLPTLCIRLCLLSI
jgi:hypothetical protein